jgi:predicted RNA-binding Zn ribbon-like protein
VSVSYAWEHDEPERPTPEEIAIVERFLNTVDEHTFGRHAAKPDQHRDLFRTPADLHDWLVDERLIPDGLHASSRDLSRARRLRTGLREWLRQRHGLPYKAAAVEAAAFICRRLPLHVDLHPLQLSPSAAGIDAALASIVGHLPVAEASGTLDRLKMCAADDCRFVYYDHSRSRTSQWCSTDVCGNRIKTRRYRHRHS